MPQLRKPASSVTRKEFDALARKVETATSTLREDRKRITALEKSDHDLEERMNRKFVEIEVKIDAIGVKQQDFSRSLDVLIKDQETANADVAAKLGLLVASFRLDEGDDAKGRFREDMTFLRKLRMASEDGKGFAHNAVIGLIVAGVGSVLVAGIFSLFGVKP